jgi:hypothetical protein
VANLTTDQANALTSTQVQTLTTAQLRQLNTTQVASLNSSQIQSLTTAQLRAITTTQLRAIETTDISALTTTQLSAVKAAGMGFDYTDAQMDAIRATGKTLSQITPLVIDLGRDGISTRSITEGVTFDLDRDGQLDATAWVGSADGLLVRDLNGDGIVNDGSELFGSFTDLTSGARALDGYQALRDLDKNQDGFIDSSDSAWGSIMVWQDLDGDGITDADEMRTLQDVGVTRLSTSVRVDVSSQNGNVVALHSDVMWADGTTGQMADIWFQADLSDADAVIESLDDALARYAQESLGASTTEIAGDGVEASTDASLAMSQELMSFDSSGSEVSSTLVAAASVFRWDAESGSSDPDELLRKQAGAGTSGSLGQT